MQCWQLEQGQQHNQWHGVQVDRSDGQEPMCSLTRSKAVLRVADGKPGFYTWQLDTVRVYEIGTN